MASDVEGSLIDNDVLVPNTNKAWPTGHYKYK